MELLKDPLRSLTCVSRLITLWSIITIVLLGFVWFPAFISNNGRLVEEKTASRIQILGKNYVCSIQSGRLGNHMFQYASLYGIARSNNSTMIVTESYDLIDYFNLLFAKIAENYFHCFLFKKVLEKNACCTFDETLMDLPENRNYVVGDWLQSWKYFRDVFPEIRREFTFRENIRRPAEYIVRNLKYTKSGDATVVGIHIRAGDMIGNVKLERDGYRTAPPSYIRNAINFMRKQYKNIVFIVCSDDLAYSRSVIGNRTNEVYYFSISPAQDMAILSECDHVIMTVGTYGWWAGFLSNGTVIYYKHPYIENTPKWLATKYEDFYLPDWIALE